MKRLRLDETVKEGGGSLSSTLYRQPISNSSTLSYSTASTVKVVSEGMQTGIYPSTPTVNYGTMPTVAVTHSGHSQIRGSDNSPPTAQEQSQQQSPGSNFHRLKVEDALSYLDLVKFKFNSKPQVYNDFLDIMKEFKSQSIDTPGVIERVSNLFDGFPDLIVGFNTFLPPGYKIEVQKNQDGYAFHVSVSMGNIPGGSDNHHKTSMIMKGSGTINTSVCGQPITHTQQSLPVPSHVSPVAPQAPPVQQQSIVHHSNSYAPSATSYNSLSLSAAQAAVSQALQGHTETPQNQPVEFNHAINYVNKIKNRFQGQPEKYKRFLEILHTYQKEQRTLKETTGGLGGKQLTEQEVYSQVAKLFENQSDLLAEFGQFLPDATSHMNQVQASEHHVVKKPQIKPTFRENMLERNVPTKIPLINQKRSLSPYSSSRESHQQKKHKMSSCRDVTLAEAGKYGSLSDFAFFDKLRDDLKSNETYENFLRCLTLYNEQIVTKSELVLMINPLIGKFPELMKWFRDFLRQHEVENVPYNSVQNERPKGDLAQEIDFATAKRLGASYCIIQPSKEVQVSSSRTQLCKEVLNDQWVSFPTWSEDSTFVGSRKTQYEEYMYRCEDERFEMDVVIETNASTIRVLENIQKKINRMKPEEVANFTLDDTLGGTSGVLHQKALKRIYGERAKDIIDGLKCNPAAAISTILARLKSKEAEWREAQKGFNKIWREQNEKYYLKSLDHQGMNFKPTDLKALRSKSLFNEIETLFDERHERNEDGREVTSGPHIVIPYKDRTILDDAANLLIHNVKRQTGIQKSEKVKMKQLLLRTIPDFFFHPRQHLSDDEGEDDKDDEESPGSSPNNNKITKSTNNPGKSPVRSDIDKCEMECDREQTLQHAQSTDPEEAYTLFMGNNNWYIFLRLHAILCDRLAKIYERSVIMAEEEAKQQPKRKESTAISLRLKPKPQIEVHDYYPAFLDMVKSLLDGNMDSNTYEDTLREMFGIYAYVAFTLDKVVSYAVRQLQHCVTEKTASACTDLFMKEQKRGATGGPSITAYKRAHAEFAYQRAAEKAVLDENCFKMFFYKKDCRMSIELLDTENDDGKRVEETKKWSMYKECYSDCTSTGKIKSPVFLERNLRLYKKRASKNISHSRRISKNHQNLPSTAEDKSEKSSESAENNMDDFERELREQAMPERNKTNHPGYHVADDTECKFNTQDSKIVFTSNKDSYIYKISALERAKESHPRITMRLSTRFKYWLKGWVSENVSDTQHKQCMDWLMGRCEGTVPNRTRVLTDNDTSRPPYMSYNRYKVDQLIKDAT